MIKRLFKLYRKTPFWARDWVARSTWPLRLATRPFSTIRVGGYSMTLDFMDNASFKYFTDREGYEANEVDAFIRAIARNPGSYVIDVGANYGAYSLAVAAQLGRYGVFEKILAIEPDARAHSALTRSIAKNGFGGLIDLHRCIADDKMGEQTLYVNARSSADNRTHSVLSAPIRLREQYKMPSVTIDSLVRSLGYPMDSRFIIKMDIQGNEFRAFKGMKELLSRASGYLVFFEHCPFLIESAGLSLSEYHRFIEDLAPQGFVEIGPEGLIDLGSFEGFEASVDRLLRKKETLQQGAGENYIVYKNMNLL
jgi:FkbM family methyltransferase